MMKKISLVNSSKHAIVDDGDFEEMSRYEWRLVDGGYAGRYVGKGKNRRLILMHEQVMAKARDEAALKEL